MHFNNAIIIYHHGCPDGLASIWCFSKLVSEEQFYPGKFGDVISDELAKNKDLIFVDFSYRAPIMQKLLKICRSILVLDHHKTAKDLEDINDPKFTMILDMNRSGCQITYDYLNQQKQGEEKQERPWFTDHIADRDLYKWTLPNSKFTTIAMFKLGYYGSLKKFNEIKDKGIDYFIKAGEILAVAEDLTVTQIAAKAKPHRLYSVKDRGVSWPVMALMCDHMFASDVGAKIYTGNSNVVALIRYNFDKSVWDISLRTSDTGPDLTEIAKHFELGGGHAKAAGITINDNINDYLKPIV